MRTCRTIAFLMLCAHALVIGQSPPDDTTKIMPRGFEGIRLGMPTRELVDLRNDIKPHIDIDSPSDPDTVKVDTSLPDQFLFENRSDKETFKYIIFEIKTGVLQGFTCYGAPPIETYQDTIHGMIDDFNSSYGRPPERYVTTSDPEGKGTPLPMLVWRTNKHSLRMGVFPDFTRLTKFFHLKTGMISIQVSNEATIDIKKEYHLAKLGDEDVRLLFSSIGLKD